MIRTSRNRRLGFESLEGRQLLAGNVIAGLDVNGNLVLTGDLANNAVMVTRAFFNGQVLVQGGRSNPSDPSTATTVNGQTTSLSFDTSGGIIANMGDGSDSVLVTNLGVQGSITGSLGK